MSNYQIEWIDHPSDICFKIRAATVEDIFRGAAETVVDLSLRPPRETKLSEKIIEVEASDRELLLARWLQEILYLLEVKHFIPIEYEVIELTEEYLQIKVRGDDFDPEKVVRKKEIKAVTYHQLYVKATPKGWEAQVLVDV